MENGSSDRRSQSPKQSDRLELDRAIRSIDQLSCCRLDCYLRNFDRR